MIFQKYLTSKRLHAENILQDFFHEYTKEFEHEQFSSDVIHHLQDSIPKGKLMRFSLTQLGYEGYSESSTKAVEILGMCLECVHSGLLFHDDIIDQDNKRRGTDALHVSYSKTYAKTANESNRLGESLAMCTADFIFFLVFDVLSQLDIDNNMKQQIVSIISREFARVSLAQMQDTLWGHTSIEPTHDEIIHMYKGKTGRYSVSLPFVLGAVMAHAPTSDIPLLWNIGETLGILYQIRDDYLSLFGDESVTGKPIGSDISQNKKTLFRYYLLAHASESMKLKLNDILGHHTITHENLHFVCDCLEKTGTLDWINSITTDFSASVRRDIEKLTMNKKTKEILLDFLLFVGNRNI
jgi:geranylgeranyl diphosphate synthase, type I